MSALQTAVETAEIAVKTMDPSIVAIITAVMTALLFPFVMHFFKKNERLHEQTQAKVADHAITLGLHEYRLISLEEWRRIHPTPPPAQQPNMTVNN